jgi:hypothetical protein
VSFAELRAFDGNNYLIIGLEKSTAPQAVTALSLKERSQSGDVSVVI